MLGLAGMKGCEGFGIAAVVVADEPGVTCPVDPPYPMLAPVTQVYAPLSGTNSQVWRVHAWLVSPIPSNTPQIQ